MAGKAKFNDRKHKRHAGFYQFNRYIRKVKCAKCGSIEKLHYHHIVPLQWGGNPSDTNNIIVLCKDCHLEIHIYLQSLLIEILTPNIPEITKRCHEPLNCFIPFTYVQDLLIKN